MRAQTRIASGLGSAQGRTAAHANRATGTQLGRTGDANSDAPPPPTTAPYNGRAARVPAVILVQREPSARVPCRRLVATGEWEPAHGFAFYAAGDMRGSPTGGMAWHGLSWTESGGPP